MNAIPQHISGASFHVPPDVVTETICKESGQIALPSVCPVTVEEYFLAGNRLAERCAIHRGPGPLERVINGVKDLFKAF
jgi:hypothetical protein